MSEVLDQPFKHGAQWVRADFHLHTIKEKCPSRKELRKEWEGKEDKFPQAFVDKLVEEDIRVACITNHDHLDVGEFKAIEKRAKKKNILVLPGIELNIQGGTTGIHTLVIFNPEQVIADNTSINAFTETQCPNKASKDYITKDTLASVLSGLDNLEIDYFIIFAHVNNPNGLLNEVKGPNRQALYREAKNLWDKRVLGFQKFSTSNFNGFKNSMGDIPIPAFVEGSDPKKNDEIGLKGNGMCYLKLSDLSYSAVKFALRDRLEDTFPRVAKQLPESPVASRIESVTVHSSVKKHIFHYDFSSGLNTMVGSRGSGKSLVLEALRWGLNKPVKADALYKDGLIHAFLDKGGVVEISALSVNGEPIKIKRTYLGKRDQSSPEVYLNEELVNVSISTLLPNLLYFGQKDLGERSEDTSDSSFFEQILGRPDAELVEKISIKKRSLEDLAQQYLNAKKAKSEDAEYAYELKALNEKLKVFKEKGIEQKMREITDFDSDLSRFRSFYKDLVDFKPSFDDAREVFMSYLTSLPDLTSPLNQDIVPKVREFKEQATKIELSQNTQIEEVDHFILKLKEFGVSLKNKKEQLQARFAEILQSVNEPDLDIDGFRNMVTRASQLERLRKLTQEGISAEDRLKREILNLGDEFLELKRTLSTAQKKRLNEINSKLPSSLRLGNEFAASEEQYADHLSTLFRGKNFNQTALQKLVEQTSSGIEIFKRLDTLCNTELTPAMGDKLKEMLEEHFISFITYVAPDKRIIEYNDKKIEALSLGKRAMALLLLLLSLDEYGIIIIDQPEDDLDNETIHNMVVTPLRDKKADTQFIIATHNPNIPVLADAEQVIACKELARDTYEHTYGSIDKPETKEDIIKIMEGGQDAFDRRKTIYNSWTN